MLHKIKQNEKMISTPYPFILKFILILKSMCKTTVIASNRPNQTQRTEYYNKFYQIQSSETEMIIRIKMFRSIVRFTYLNKHKNHGYYKMNNSWLN